MNGKYLNVHSMQYFLIEKITKILPGQVHKVSVKLVIGKVQ